MNKVSEVSGTGGTIKFVIGGTKEEVAKLSPNPLKGVLFIPCEDLKSDESIIVYEKE